MLITISCALAGGIPADLVLALLVDCTLTYAAGHLLLGCCCGGPPSGPRSDLPPHKSVRPSARNSSRDQVKRQENSGRTRPRTAERTHPPERRNSTQVPVSGPPGPSMGQTTYVSARPGMQERGKHAVASLDIRARRPLTPEEWMEPESRGS